MPMRCRRRWLHPTHPDPEAKNLRQIWLPALEWIYSERVRQQVQNSVSPINDAAVLAAADFGVFIDLTSMCQKEGGERNKVEEALFRHSLQSLDVIYAHEGLGTLLSTRLPEGVDVALGYDDRGWTNFERAEAELIKPVGFCIDIGLFTVDKACEAYLGNRNPLRIGGARFAERTVEELAQQGSYSGSAVRGVLGALVGRGRHPPLAPAAFSTLLAGKQFTNGADVVTVIQLYTETATALLGSARELEYKELEWAAADYVRLGEALRYCGALETLTLRKMGLGDADAAAILVGPPLPSVKTLNLLRCESLTALPDLSVLPSLVNLDLHGCSALTALPDVSGLAHLRIFHDSRGDHVHLDGVWPPAIMRERI